MFKIIKAHILCELYLLFCGMWRGERKLVVFGNPDNNQGEVVIFIGTVTGTKEQFFDLDMSAIKKTFHTLIQIPLSP